MTQVAARPRRRTRVLADLDIEVSRGGDTLRMHLSSSGEDLVLSVSDPSSFAGSGDARAVADVADLVAGWGLRVHVVDDRGRRLLSVGNVRAPWWQRPFTGTRHLRVVARRGAWVALRGRVGRAEPLMPTGGLGAPPTLLPLAPTFLRRQVRTIATTDTSYGGGTPRLVRVSGDGVWRAEQETFWLQSDTTIGSDPSCDIVLEGLAPLHAEVRRNSDDEFVLLARDPRTRVHGQVAREQLLRTSARVELADITLAFVREEFADHGRPHGGRTGGELGRQQPQHLGQPPRDNPDLPAPGA